MSYIKRIEPARSSDLYILETRADGALVDLSDVLMVSVIKWDASSPNAPALYVPVSSEPAHEGKFQDKRGNWFELQLIDGWVLAAWLGDGAAGVVRATEITGFIKGTAGATYDFTSTSVITFTDRNVDIDLSASHIIRGNNTVFYVTHSWSSEQQITAMNDNVFTVEDGSVFSPGDIWRWGTTTPLWHRRVGGCAGECSRVLSVSGNNITITRPRYAYVELPPTIQGIETLEIADVRDDGAGGILIETTYPHFYEGNWEIVVADVTGTTEANGTWEFTVTGANTLTLDGSTFTNAYVSGGSICLTFQYSMNADPRLVAFRSDLLTSIKLGTIYMPQSNGSNEPTVTVENCLNPIVETGATNWSGGFVIYASRCFGGTLTLGPLASAAGDNGYGVNLGNCEDMTIYTYGGGEVRHLVDGGGGTSDPTNVGSRGDCAFNRVIARGVVFGSSQAAFATHHGTYKWTFESVNTNRCYSSIAVRSVGHMLLNCVSEGPYSGYSCFAQHTYNGTISNNGLGAIRVTHESVHDGYPEFETGQKVRVIASTYNNGNGYWYVTRISANIVDLIGSTYNQAGGCTVDPNYSYSGEMAVKDCTVDGGIGVTGWKNTVSSSSFRARILPGYEPSGFIGFSGELTLYDSVVAVDGVVLNRVFLAGSSDASFSWRGGELIFGANIASRVIDTRGYTTVPIQLNDLIIRNPNDPVEDLIDANGELPGAGTELGNIRITGGLTGHWIRDQLAAAIQPYVVGPLYIGATQVQAPPALNIGVVDGVTAPSAIVGIALQYADGADGDLKEVFGDGTRKTIVTDT